MKKILTFDAETTTFNKGSPYSQCNQLVSIAWKFMYGDVKVGHVNDPSGIPYGEIQAAFDTADIIVGFNLKFDLAWLKRMGINVDGKKLYDCQLAYYISNNQSTPYPSLNDALKDNGLEVKLDVIKTEYWDKGIDTIDIPKDILLEYNKWDVIQTEKLYIALNNKISGKQATLVSLSCQDIYPLLEMESEGMIYKAKESEQAGLSITDRIDIIDKQLVDFFEVKDLPINFASRDHLSALLYGGIIKWEERIPIGYYMTGEKKGQVRNKVLRYQKEFNGITEPLKGSEKKKEGLFATDMDTIKSLKVNNKERKILDLLQERSELIKLSSTYLLGLPKKIKDNDFAFNKLHGRFNQVVVITGRLSSSDPNLQNIPSDAKEYIVSRWS